MGFERFLVAECDDRISDFRVQSHGCPGGFESQEELSDLLPGLDREQERTDRD